MWKLKIQLHGGKGSSTTNVQSYTPTAAEQRLQNQEADYSEAVAPNALYLNTKARGLLENSIGETQVDYNALNNSAQNQIASAQNGVNGLINGELPSAYQQNMENSIKSGVQNSMGTMLSDLGNRGVLNSSVTDKGIADINDSASQAMTNAYSNNIGLLSQLYGQKVNTATGGITAGAAAQEAAQQPALNLWNASLGLNGATTGALGALAGQGTTTATQSSSGGGVFGGLVSGLASGAMSAFCFAEDTQIEIPDNKFKPIQKLKVGDEVVCRNEQTGSKEKASVTEILAPVYQDVYTVVCSGDNFVSTTLTQPLLKEDNTWILVSNLTPGTVLMNTGKVMSVIYSGERKVYDLKVTGSNNYYANGFVAKGGTNEWEGEK